MLALYIASKGGTAFQASQDWLPQDQWGDRPLQEGSIALAWRIIRARAEQIFTPPWQQFLRCRVVCGHTCPVVLISASAEMCVLIAMH